MIVKAIDKRSKMYTSIVKIEGQIDDIKMR